MRAIPKTGSSLIEVTIDEQQNTTDSSPETFGIDWAEGEHVVFGDLYDESQFQYPVASV